MLQGIFEAMRLYPNGMNSELTSTFIILWRRERYTLFSPSSLVRPLYNKPSPEIYTYIFSANTRSIEIKNVAAVITKRI